MASSSLLTDTAKIEETIKMAEEAEEEIIHIYVKLGILHQENSREKIGQMKEIAPEHNNP